MNRPASRTAVSAVYAVWERSTGASGSKDWIAGINTDHRFLIGRADDSGGLTNEYLTVLDTGNVGIGTTGSNAKLYIKGSGAAGNSILTIDASSGAGNYNQYLLDARTDSPQLLDLTSRNDDGNYKASLMTWTSDGKVGIGTTPAVALDIKSEGELGLGAFSQAQINVKTPGKIGTLIFNTTAVVGCVSTGTTVMGYAKITGGGCLRAGSGASEHWVQSAPWLCELCKAYASPVSGMTGRTTSISCCAAPCRGSNGFTADGSRDRAASWRRRKAAARHGRCASWPPSSAPRRSPSHTPRCARH